MTIGEAIKILSDEAYGGTVTFNEAWRDAIKLGIEALKFYAAIKKPPHISTHFPLPGETEE